MSAEEASAPSAGADGDGPPGPDRRGLLSFSALLGAALVLMGAGLAFTATGFDKAGTVRVLGKNKPVNVGARLDADISAHNSPSLVANPRNGANLVIANRIDSPRFSCALHVSFDGGGHWAQTPIPLPAGEEPKCYSPDAVFGADGTMYLSFVTLAGRANAPNAAWIVRSTDGGQTLSAPVRTLGKLSFQVRLAADPSAPRRIYLTWLQGSEVGLFKFTDPGNPIRSIRSDDAGRTWSKPVSVNDGGRERVVAPAPAVGADGLLYVLYLDLGDDALDYHGGHRGQGGPPYPGRWQLVMARSDDRAATWKEAVVDDAIVPSERFIAFTPPFPSVAIERSSGRVYVAFHDARDGDPDIRVWTLARGDRAWGPPVKVNDTAPGDRSWQLLPRLAVAPDGRLDVVYYDRRADRSNVMTEVSLQSSFDGAASFLPRVRLSDRRFDARIGYGGERGIPDLGSRLGLVSAQERALGVWTDTRAGTRRSGKQDLASGLVAVSPPEDISSGLKTLLRVVGILLALTGAGLIALAAARRTPPERTPGRRRTPTRKARARHPPSRL